MSTPAPTLVDLDTAGFWEAASRRELVVRSCLDCKSDLHFPRAYCKHCGSWNTLWRQVSPSGTLYSWIVPVRQTHPAFAVPYTVVLVELNDAPAVRLLGNLAGTPKLIAGMAMSVDWQELPNGTVIPQWQIT